MTTTIHSTPAPRNYYILSPLYRIRFFLLSVLSHTTPEKWVHTSSFLLVLHSAVSQLQALFSVCLTPIAPLLPYASSRLLHGTFPFKDVSLFSSSPFPHCDPQSLSLPRSARMRCKPRLHHNTNNLRYRLSKSLCLSLFLPTPSVLVVR